MTSTWRPIILIAVLFVLQTHQQKECTNVFNTENTDAEVQEQATKVISAAVDAVVGDNTNAADDATTCSCSKRSVTVDNSTVTEDQIIDEKQEQTGEETAAAAKVTKIEEPPVVKEIKQKEQKVKPQVDAKTQKRSKREATPALDEKQQQTKSGKSAKKSKKAENVAETTATQTIAEETATETKAENADAAKTKDAGKKAKSNKKQSGKTNKNNGRTNKNSGKNKAEKQTSQKSQKSQKSKGQKSQGRVRDEI